MKVLSYFTFCLQGVFPLRPQWRQAPPRLQHRAHDRENTAVLFLFFHGRWLSSPMAAMVSRFHRDPAARYKAYCSIDRGEPIPRSASPAERARRPLPGSGRSSQWQNGYLRLGWRRVSHSGSSDHPTGLDGNPATASNRSTHLSHCRLTVRVVHRREAPARNAGLDL